MRLLDATLTAAALAGAGTAQGACAANGAVELFGEATPGALGKPRLAMGGAPLVGHPFHLAVQGAVAGTPGVLLAGLSEVAIELPGLGATAYPGPPHVLAGFVAGRSTTSPPLLELAPVGPQLCGVAFVAQAALYDPLASSGAAFTGGVRARFGAPGAGLGFAGSNVGVGPQPLGITVGDLNGDQHADLAVATAGLDVVEVLLGRGDGTFGAPASYGSTLNGPCEIAHADLDGDAAPDLVVVHTPAPYLSIYAGRGDGTFADGVPLHAGTLKPDELVLGDWNVDGVVDVAVSHLNDRVTVRAGLGDGGFAPEAAYDVGDNPTEIASADLDLDGVADLATVHFSSHDASVLRGGPGGVFTVRPPHAVGYAPTGLALADVDGDLVPDLVTSHYLYTGGEVRVFRGLGAGGFAPAGVYAVGDNANSPAVADLDGDLVPDIVITNALFSSGYAIYEGSAAVLRGLGGGSFADPVAFETDALLPSGLGIGDVNGDLLPDLLVTHDWSGNVSVLLNGLLD
ncbi:MAG: VCBS repeat-containing protein [Planctomycetota bacterium]